MSLATRTASISVRRFVRRVEQDELPRRRVVVAVR